MLGVDARVTTGGRVWLSILLLLSVLIFWKVRILDLGTNPAIELGPIDLYVEHMPMAEYAYDELAGGNLPLWNPYQLCGQPFIAVPHVAAFYPLHIFSFVFDAVTSVEISFLLHMFLGGLGMWLLSCRLGLSRIGATGAAVTFMWSGWIVFMNVVPGIFASMNWLPITILLLDRAVNRAQFGIVLLIASVASQILLGATEVLLHTMYVGAAFTACRLSQMAWRGSPAGAAKRGGAILAAIAAALLIAAPQLLPSIEFGAESGRGSGTMSFQAAVLGAIKPHLFIRDALGATGLVTVGFLPFLALPLGFGVRQHRFIWLFALGAVLVAALLVFGGPVYQAYYSLPVVGGLFRRPSKFLDIYAFGQALMAGIALAQLQLMASSPRTDLWRNARWLTCLGLVAAAFVWTAITLASPVWFWLGCLCLLLTFGVLRVPRWRVGILVGLVALQASSLFFEVGGTHVRPIARPEIFHTHDSVLDSLRQRAGHERVHLSTYFLAVPGLTPKQGILHRLRVSADYEPLVSYRYQRFFDKVSPDNQAQRVNRFAGMYFLSPSSNWKLMDLTASRYYAMASQEPATRFMRNHPSEFRPLHGSNGVEIFERTNALPRAYLVPTAQTFESADDVLSALARPDFAPQHRVLLEEQPIPRAQAADGFGQGSVDFVIDEGEQVVVDVSTPNTTFLVLSDLFYPGWRAFVGDREIKIYRANYLFRAVQLDPGEWRVRFEYAPESFRLGLLASGLTLLVLMTCFIWRYRRRA